MELAEVWKSTPAIGAAVVAVLGALYKSIKALLEFNDEYLRKRRLKHLTFLLNEAAGDPVLKEFFSAAKHEQLFRTVFGRPASRRTAVAVMGLHASGRFSVEQLRASAPYWRLGDDGRLDIQPGAAGTFVLWTSAFFVFVIGIYVAAVVVKLLALKSAPALVAVLVFLLLFIAVVFFFGRDMRAVLLARRAESELKNMREYESGAHTELDSSSGT